MQKTIDFRLGNSNEEKLEHLKKEWRILMNEYVPGYTSPPYEVWYAIIHKTGSQDEKYQHNPNQLENADSFSLFYVIAESLKIKDNTQDEEWIAIILLTCF